MIPIKKIRRIVLNITDYCFSDCKFCRISRTKKEKPEFTEKDIIPMLRILKQYNSGVYIAISGGEPLLKYNLTSKIAKYCKFIGIRTTISTNGFLIKDAEQFLHDCPTEYLLISIESDDEQYNDDIRGLPGHFKKVIEIVPKLREIIDRNNLKITLQSASILTKYNYQRQEELEKFFKNLGFDNSVFNNLLCTFWGDINAPHNKEFRDFYNEYKTKAPSTIIDCRAKDFGTLMINPDGNISPCLHNMFYTDDFLPEGTKRFSLINNDILNYFLSEEYKIVSRFLSSCRAEACFGSDTRCYG